MIDFSYLSEEEKLKSLNTAIFIILMSYYFVNSSPVISIYILLFTSFKSGSSIVKSYSSVSYFLLFSD